MMVSTPQSASRTPVAPRALVAARGPVQFAAVAVLLLAAGSARAQTCPADTPSNVRTGDVTLTTQAQVDAFGAECYTSVQGSLRVDRAADTAADPITTLSPLSSITSVNSLQIEDTNQLTSLAGLENLRGSASLSLVRNSELSSIDALSGLTVYYVNVQVNGKLASLSGPTMSESLQTLTLTRNPSLTDLAALSSVRRVTGAVQIVNNAGLADLSPLVGLESVGNFVRISENPSLLSLDGLGGLREVVNDFRLFSNTTLAECSAIVPLLSGGGIGGGIEIRNNATGCDSVLEILPADHPLQVSASGGGATDPETHVLVTWTPTGEPGVFHEIQRRTAGGTLQTLTVQPDTSTTYKDASALPGTDYEYCVRSVGSASGTAASLRCDVGRRDLRLPPRLRASDSTRVDGVALQWSDLSGVELGYVVFRAEAGGTPVAIDTTGADIEGYLDDTAESLVVYDYAVGLLHAEGGAETVAEPYVTDRGTRGAIAPPAGVDATDGTFADRVRVSWAELSGATASVYQIFEVYRNGATATDTTLVASGLTNTSIDVPTTASEGATYCVVAVTPEGAESVWACDTGRSGALPGPTALEATDGTSDGAVELNWEAPDGAETGFRVYRGQAGDADADVLEGAPVATTTRARYRDTGAVPDVAHRYCVTAIAEGVVDGAPATNESAAVCADGRRVAVLAPTDVAASQGVTAHEAHTEVTWDTQSTVTQMFQVLRDGVAIVTLPASARGYSDPTGVAGTEYSYTVRAFAVVDDGADAATVVQGLAPIFAQAEAERSTLEGGRADAKTADEVDRVEAQAAAVEAELVDDISGVLAGLGVDASALTASATTGTLRNATSAPAQGWRVVNAPASLTATTDREDTVVLTWEDRSEVEDGFWIEITDTNGHAAPRVEWILPNTTEWPDTGSVPFSETTYRIRAYDRRDGDAVASGSDAVEATGVRALLQPTDLTASKGTYEDRVVLTWRDNSRAETGYEVHFLQADTRDTVTVARHEIFLPDEWVGSSLGFRVRAINEHSVGADPGATTVGHATLVTPSVFTASTGYTDRVVLSWTDDSNENTRYRITGPGGYVATEGPDATTHTRLSGTFDGEYTVVPTGDREYSKAPVPVTATGRLLTAADASSTDTGTTAGGAGGLGLSPSAELGAAVAADGPLAVAGAPGNVESAAQRPEWSRPFDASTQDLVKAGGLNEASYVDRGGGRARRGVRVPGHRRRREPERGPPRSCRARRQPLLRQRDRGGRRRPRRLGHRRGARRADVLLPPAPVRPGRRLLGGRGQPGVLAPRGPLPRGKRLHLPARRGRDLGPAAGPPSERPRDRTHRRRPRLQAR